MRDPAVINQYLKRREENRLEYLMNNPEELEKLGDENLREEDKELLKEAYVHLSPLDYGADAQHSKEDRPAEEEPGEASRAQEDDARGAGVLRGRDWRK